MRALATRRGGSNCERKRVAALRTVGRSEGRTVELCVSRQTQRSLLLLHYSNGDEATAACLRRKAEEFGPLTAFLLPCGLNYAYVAFRDEAAALCAYAALNSQAEVLPLAPKPHPVSAEFTSMQPEDLRVFTHNCEDSAAIPGLRVLPSFLSVQEEEFLLSRLSAIPLQVLTNHKTQRFGRPAYEGEDISAIPQWAGDVCGRISSALDSEFDHMTVCEFAPGDGFPPRIDSNYGEITASIQMKSAVGVELRKGNVRRDVWIPPRSLLVLENEARYDWKLSLPERKIDIYRQFTIFRTRSFSLTFRRVTKTPLSSRFPSDPTYVLPSSREIQKKYVQETYEKIASHFSHTRYKPWPKVKEFIERLPVGSVVLDVGCGNGKYLPVNPSCVLIGTDFSHALLSVASQRGGCVFRSDSLCLPVRSESVDAVLSVAVLHHFDTLDQRLAAAREILRVLKVGGKALVYVWAKEELCLSLPHTWQAKEQSERSFDAQDCLVPWDLQPSGDVSKRTYYRFYHVFLQGELQSLLALARTPQCAFAVSSGYYDHSNWCVECTKVNISS